MDVLLAPKTEREKGISTRYKFLYFAGASTKPLNYEYSGFYYIGRNHAHIEKLVNTYVRGYASDGLENAKSELLRSIGLEKNILPEVIICEITYDVEAIRRFIDFLRTHPPFASIPFVLEGSGFPGRDLMPFRQHARPDEILRLERMDEAGIRRKVQFLRNIKGTKSKGADPRLGRACSS